MANAKNEAKIKFTAETQEFESAINSAKSELSTLRAEMKLAEAAFKNTGNSAEYMESRVKILEAQLQANAEKQEALTQKLEAAKAIYGEGSEEVAKLERALINAQTEEQKLTGELQQCTREVNEQTAAEEKARTPLEQLNSTIAEQRSELEQLKTQYKNVALESGSESTEAQELKAKIDQLNSELGENEAKLKEVDAALDDTGSSAESAANGGWTVFKGVVSDLASNAIQQGIDKIKEFGKETVQLGIDFSSSMSNVQALSGATDEELSQLEQTARDLGASTIFSASDVSDAFGYMALAGWDVQDMLSGIDGVLNLAAAADMDLATASDIVTDNLTAFGLSAQDSGAFVDQMAYAMANSNTNVEQLGEAYKNCASTANSMGFSVEDTTAALMTMANAGVKGGEAGTGLSSIMTRLATDTKGCASELAEYGVEVYDSQGNMNDLSSILNGCAQVWGDLSDEEQANLAKTIAGQNQFSKFQTVMQGLSDQAAESGSSFNDYTQALEDVKTASEGGQSAAEDMANTMQDNLGGDIKELNSAMEEFKLKIFDSVEQPMRNAVQFVTGTVIPAATQALQFIQQHSTAFGILGVAIGIITTAIIAHSAAQAIQTAMNAAEVSSLGALITAKLASAAASMAALAPYILIVAAIAGVIAIIVLAVKHWDQIREKIISASEAIRSKATELWNKLRTAISNAVTGIKSKVTSIWSGIRNATTNTWNNIKSGIQNAITGAQNIVTNIITAIKSKVSSVWSGIRSTTSSVWNSIKTAITTPISAARSTVSNIFTSIKNKIKSAMDGAKNAVSSAISSIKSKFHFSWSLPKLKLPHISISGKFSINPPSAPHFSISWHRLGAIFRKATLIPTLAGIHGVGEAGPEAVSPISTLQDYVDQSVRENVPTIDYDRMGVSVARACAGMDIRMELDRREVGRVVRGYV